jgi:DNA-directed RNA polymerase subunit alpha
MAKTRIRIDETEQQARLRRQRLEMSTAEIGLSVRTTNCLEERGVFTVRDLLNCKPEFLLSISNFGEKTLEEVYRALESIGFYRPGREPKTGGTRPGRSAEPTQPSVRLLAESASS